MKLEDEIADRDRARAVTACLAFAQNDRRAFHRATDAVFDEFGGYRRLVAALADLVVEGYDVEHQGDRFAVAEQLRRRRELAAVR